MGKSTLFDAFGFLSDCLSVGVEEACDMRGRGGFEKLLSAGSDGPLRFEIYYREGRNERPITYELVISRDRDDRPFVNEERLRQRRKGQKRRRPFSFLYLHSGKGPVWRGDASATDEEEGWLSEMLDEIYPELEEETAEKEWVELTDNRKLGIATLGALKDHPRVTRFRNFLQGWYLSYFTPDAARSLPMAGPQKHLSSRGDNLGNVVQYMEREHKDRFQAILDRIAEKIPGIDKIGTNKTADG